jgi:hypothetical protein
MGEASPIANHQGPHLQGARECLVTWRFDTWMLHYCRCPWGVQCLLPGAVITTITTRARLKTVDDLINVGWSPTYGRRHGEEVLKLLGDYDAEYHCTHQAEKLERAQKKKQETAERQAAKREANKLECAQQCTLHMSQPKKPQPSHSKKQPNILNDLTVPNTHPLIPSPDRYCSTPVRLGHENVPPHLASNTQYLSTSHPLLSNYAPIMMPTGIPTGFDTAFPLNYHLSPPFDAYTPVPSCTRPPASGPSITSPAFQIPSSSLFPPHPSRLASLIHPTLFYSTLYSQNSFHRPCPTYPN